MKRVQVLLRDNVPNLGRCGDVVSVASGYARNYLMPRRIAVAATPDNVETMKRRKAQLDAEEAALLADIRARVTAISGVSLTVAERADENGHLFGSVSASTIARLLGEKGFETDERHVRLEQPIKSVGSHEVEVHVHGEYAATVSIEVTAE
jgi:large subunit ribosomal protein L9